MKTEIPIPEELRKTKATPEECANQPYRCKFENFVYEGVKYYYDKYDDKAYECIALPIVAYREKI